MEFTIGNKDEYITFLILKKIEDENPYLNEYEMIISGQNNFFKFEKRVYAFERVMKEFYEKLCVCYNELKGEVDIKEFSYDKDFSLKIEFVKTGHIEVFAMIKDIESLNKCEINFYTDQSYINLNDLKNILL